MEGPIDEQFILSPGDQIIIQVWGQLNLSYPLTVSDDGYITIPDEGGRVYTNGVNLKDLKRAVAENLSRIYSSFIDIKDPGKSTAFIDIRLVKVRKLLVYVFGEVQKPGAYTVSASAAALPNLLINAGGINESGSLREVKIRRADGTVDLVDLYDFILTGKIDPKVVQIRYGDYIIVPMKSKAVTITGEIKRNGIYEVVRNEGIKTLIQFAGGLTANANLKRAQIQRSEVNAGLRYIDINLGDILSDPAKDFALTDADRLNIFPNFLLREPKVEITGSGVRNPGTYQYTTGMKIKDLIDEAGGLRADAYLSKAELVRTEKDFTKTLTTFSFQDLYEEPQPGQFVFKGTPEKNFPLNELDTINTYSSFDIGGGDKRVTLEGHVKKEGPTLLAKKMKLADLIFSRGGLQDENFKAETYMELAHIFRRNQGEYGEKVIPFNLGKLLLGDPKENQDLEDGDRVVIYSRQVINRKPSATIEGLVNNPGTYSIAEDMTVEDLILLAGGLSPDALKVEAVIGRPQKQSGTNGDDEKTVKRVPGQKTAPQRLDTIVVPIEPESSALTKEKKPSLKNSDRVVIRTVPGWEPVPVVFLEGQFVNSGAYSLESKEERISSVIKRAGGLKLEAFPEGATLYRRRAIVEMARANLAEAWRVAFDLKSALDHPRGPDDITLMDGDRIYIPENPGTVLVSGAVNFGAVFQYKKGKGLGYYIQLAAGYRDDADKKAVIIHLPTGMAATGGLLSGPEILPGSMIYVPGIGESNDVQFVAVRGAVANPTRVQLRPGKALDYYVKLSGRYREDADTDNIVVHRSDGELIKKNGAVPFNPVIPAGSIVQVPFKIRGTQPRGYSEAEELAVPRQELAIIERPVSADIEVRGAVQNPGMIRYRAGAKFDSYIAFCGGYKENADTERISVFMPDGTIVEKKGDTFFSPQIVPGCVVEVPAKEIKK